MKTNKPNTLKKAAEAKGKSVIQLVTEAVVSEGSKLGAAHKLGVAPRAIDYHLAKAGLTVEYRQTAVIKEVK